MIVYMQFSMGNKSGQGKSTTKSPLPRNLVCQGKFGIANSQLQDQESDQPVCAIYLFFMVPLPQSEPISP